jgi:glucose/arabinose dehydrogenase
MNAPRTSLFTRIAALALATIAGSIFVIEPVETRQASPAPPVVTVVASNLHNPRGLNFAPNGALYVAEAAGNGTASADCGVMGDGQTRCSANTASITRIDLESAAVTRVVTHLPSLIAAVGTANSGAGVQDVAFQGLGNGYLTVGLGGDPAIREDYFGDAGAHYGRLGRFGPNGRFRLNEDLAGYEADNNPDGFVPDSNPYGLLALPGRVIVADAGGNDLIQVAANGEISTLAVFDRIPRPGPGPTSVQAVPTTVALGPDGDLYVGVLTGGPFTVGLANVYRVPADGGIPEVAYSGFTNIIDIAFGPDGSLYVLEIARNAIPNFGGGGRLVRIDPDGTQTDVISGPPLIAPGGVAIGEDGALYITNMSTSATAGAVLRIAP